MKFKKILEEAASKYAFQPTKETNPSHDKDYHQKEPVQFKKPKAVPDEDDKKLPKAEKDQQDVLDRMKANSELINDYDHKMVKPEGEDYAVNETDAQQLRRMMTQLTECTDDMGKKKQLNGEKVTEDKWMQKAFAHNKGGLHKSLHVPQGEKIPQDKLDAAKHSKNSHVRHMAQAAANANEDTEYDRGTDIENPPAEPTPMTGAAPMPNDPDAPVNSDSDSRIALKSIVKQMIQKYGLDSVLSAVEKVKATKDPSIAAEPVGQTEPDNLEPTQNDEE